MLIETELGMELGVMIGAIAGVVEGTLEVLRVGEKDDTKGLPQGLEG